MLVCCAVVSVRPHPEETADAATLANWARIRAELEARNYTRPSSKDVHHITRHRKFAAGEPLSGAYGVDVSSWVGQSTWSCLKNNGYSFAVVREFQEICQVDPNGGQWGSEGRRKKARWKHRQLQPFCGFSFNRSVCFLVCASRLFQCTVRFFKKKKQVATSAGFSIVRFLLISLAVLVSLFFFVVQLSPMLGRLALRTLISTYENTTTTKFAHARNSWPGAHFTHLFPPFPSFALCSSVVCVFFSFEFQLFPSYGCGTSPAGQVDAAINSMGSIPFGE